MMTTENTPNIEALLARAIEALPDFVELVYVDQGDGLTGKQVGFIIEDDWDSFYTFTEEWESDNRQSGLEALWADAMNELSDDEAEALADDDGAFYAFADACYGRESGSWLDDLIRGTPAPMIRYPLDYEVAEGATGDDAEEEAENIARVAGIDFATNRDVLVSLVESAFYGGRLHVLHRTDLADLPTGDQRGTATFTDPMLLVHDAWNGSGDMQRVSGVVTCDLVAQEPEHDAGSMSWSDGIAGIVHSCAETPVVFAPAPTADQEG